MSRATDASVVVIDDHREMAELIGEQLREAGYQVAVAAKGRDGLDAVRQSPPDLVITDLRMEDVDGLDVLDGVRALDESIPVLIMTAFGAIDSAVEAVKRGAFHYLTKPFQLHELLVYVQRALADRQLRQDHQALKRLVRDRSSLGALVGESEVMQRLYGLVEQVAPASESVLVQGESGTGKELVARALHFASPRRDRPFVAMNCMALPEALLESELFGHVRGAFTGATASRQGLFTKADGGTLFLDEIGDMPASLQAKLLRVLQDGEVRAVGSDSVRALDVRVVAASHRLLEELVEQGRFRGDLFYRLNVIPILVPPLRERAEDVPLLVRHFLGSARRANPAVRLERFSADLMAVLMSYPWPGNVRELENLVKRLAIVCTEDTADAQDVNRHAPGLLAAATPSERAKQGIVTLRQLEEEYIGWVVAQCNGNKTRAAELLGIDVSTIHRRGRAAFRAVGAIV